MNLRISKLGSGSLIFFLLLSIIFIIEPASADDGIDNSITATFNIKMESATDYKITCDITVNTIKLSGSGATYTGDEINALASSNLMLLGAVAQEFSILLDKTISNTFPSANIKALDVLPTYINNKFHGEYEVNLTNEYFGLNDSVNTHDFLNGVLGMNAKLKFNINFASETGWNNTYIVDLGNNLKYFYVGPNGNIAGNKITWHVKNGMGNQPSLEAELTLMSKDSTHEITSEDIFLEFLLESPKKKTNLIANIHAKTVNIEKYGILPDFILNLTHVYSDGIRLFIKNGFFTWEEFNQTTIKPIEEKIKNNLETPLFNQTLDFKSSWKNDTTIDCLNPYELNNMDKNPPVTTTITDKINLKIFDISSRALFGLANAGALANVSEENINFGDNLDQIGYSYNITMKMPEGITLQGENSYTWNDTIAFSGYISSESPAIYNRKKIDTIIEIEIESTDLNLLSFFTGKTELDFGMGVTENKKYNVTTIFEEFSFPEKITLRYLNSDAFRLCIEEGVFTDEEVSAFLKNDKKSLQERVNNIYLPGFKMNGKTNTKVFEDSLVWDGNIEQMGSEKPVIVQSYGHSSYPILFGLSAVPPKMDIDKYNFTFSGLDNQSVTYRMIFPQGISIKATDSLDRVEVKKLKDGRQYLEVTFTADEDSLETNVELKMTPSALFIIGIFMPCIISLIITMILIILVYILRKKRKGKKAAIIVPEENVETYENEDYYVPPPPRSR